jgi:hypothetical protein
MTRRFRPPRWRDSTHLIDARSRIDVDMSGPKDASVTRRISDQSSLIH